MQYIINQNSEKECYVTLLTMTRPPPPPPPGPGQHTYIHIGQIHHLLQEVLGVVLKGVHVILHCMRVSVLLAGDLKHPVTLKHCTVWRGEGGVRGKTGGRVKFITRFCFAYSFLGELHTCVFPLPPPSNFLYTVLFVYPGYS